MRHVVRGFFQRVRQIWAYRGAGDRKPGVRREYGGGMACPGDGRAYDIRAVCRDFCRVPGSCYCGNAGYDPYFFQKGRIPAWAWHCRAGNGFGESGGKPSLFREGGISAWRGVGAINEIFKNFINGNWGIIWRRYSDTNFCRKVCRQK